MSCHTVVQKQLQPKITLKQITTADPLFAQPAVEPVLTESNVATRFLLVPPEVWPEYAWEDSGGFTAKAMKCDKRTKCVTLKFQDTTQRFEFHAVAKYKPLT